MSAKTSSPQRPPTAVPRSSRARWIPRANAGRLTRFTRVARRATCSGHTCAGRPAARRGEAEQHRAQRREARDAEAPRAARLDRRSERAARRRGAACGRRRCCCQLRQRRQQLPRGDAPAALCVSHVEIRDGGGGEPLRRRGGGRAGIRGFAKKKWLRGGGTQAGVVGRCSGHPHLLRRGGGHGVAGCVRRPGYPLAGGPRLEHLRAPGGTAAASGWVLSPWVRAAARALQPAGCPPASRRQVAACSPGETRSGRR